MQRSNTNIFHVAKVHSICHGLVIHPLHRLAAEKEDRIHTSHHSSNTTLESPWIKTIVSSLCLKSLSDI